MQGAAAFSGRGGPYDDPGITRITEPIRSRVSLEEKAAHKFLDLINVISMDPNLFAYCILQYSRGIMRDRVMDIVKAIINTYADNYDVGLIDDAGRDAKRLQDAMRKYRM